MMKTKVIAAIALLLVIVSVFSLQLIGKEKNEYSLTIMSPDWKKITLEKYDEEFTTSLEKLADEIDHLSIKDLAYPESRHFDIEVTVRGETRSLGIPQFHLYGEPEQTTKESNTKDTILTAKKCLKLVENELHTPWHILFMSEGKERAFDSKSYQHLEQYYEYEPIPDSIPSPKNASLNDLVLPDERIIKTGVKKLHLNPNNHRERTTNYELIEESVDDQIVKTTVDITEFNKNENWYFKSYFMKKYHKNKDLPHFHLTFERQSLLNNGVLISPPSRENNYTYYYNKEDTVSYGRIKTLRRSNGYWENYAYTLSPEKSILQTIDSPWLRTLPNEPGSPPNGYVRSKVKTLSDDAEWTYFEQAKQLYILPFPEQNQLNTLPENESTKMK